MKKNSDNLLWGLLLIFIAVYLIGGKLGLMGKIGIFAGASLFDIILGIIFLILLIKGIAKINYEQIFFSLAFIGIIFDEQLHIKAITPWTILLAALLLSIAFNIIFPKPKRKYRERKNSAVFTSTTGNLEGERLFFRTTFGEATKYVKSDNFQYGDFNCGFGDLNIYLTDAIIQSNSATIDISVKFGELTIFLPKDWRADLRAHKSFGNIDIQRYGNADASAKILIIQGEVSFGELKIIYV